MLMNKKEAAKFLRISTPTLDRHVAAGLIIPAKLGARVFFREKALVKFIDDCERKARRRVRERVRDVAA